MGTEKHQPRSDPLYVLSFVRSGVVAVDYRVLIVPVCCSKAAIFGKTIDMAIVRIKELSKPKKKMKEIRNEFTGLIFVRQY